MNRDFDSTVFEKMRNKRIPPYYDEMYKDGYQPWEILEAAHNSIIYENEARAAQEPMEVNYKVEVINK